MRGERSFWEDPHRIPKTCNLCFCIRLCWKVEILPRRWKWGWVLGDCMLLIYSGPPPSVEGVGHSGLGVEIKHAPNSGFGPFRDQQSSSIHKIATGGIHRLPMSIILVDLLIWSPFRFPARWISCFPPSQPTVGGGGGGSFINPRCWKRRQGAHFEKN